MYKTSQHLWIGRRGALSISRCKNSRFSKSCVSSNWEDLQKGCGCCSLSQSPNWWLEEPYLCWWPPQHPSVPLATKALPGATPVRQRRCHPWIEQLKPPTSSDRPRHLLAPSVLLQAGQPRCHLDLWISRTLKSIHSLLLSFQIFVICVCLLKFNSWNPFVRVHSLEHLSIVFLMSFNDVWPAELFIFDLHEISRLLWFRSALLSSLMLLSSEHPSETKKLPYNFRLFFWSAVVEHGLSAGHITSVMPFSMCWVGNHLEWLNWGCCGGPFPFCP